VIATDAPPAAARRARPLTRAATAATLSRMKRTRVGRSTWGRLAVLSLASGLWLTGARPAAGDPPGDDGAPTGVVAFFAGGACPKGWTVAGNVQGRLVVGVTDGAGAGVQVGAPLGDREDRLHKHTYEGTVALPYKSISGADGSTNGAAAMTYPVSGTAVGATSGLPFTQVQPCVKQ
jgi:hypothetical protein